MSVSRTVCSKEEVLKPGPQHDSTKRQDLWEVIGHEMDLLRALGTLRTRPLSASSLPSLCLVSVPEMPIWRQESESSPDTRSGGALGLAFLVGSRALRIHVYATHPMVICHHSPSWTVCFRSSGHHAPGGSAGAPGTQETSSPSSHQEQRMFHPGPLVHHARM